MKGKNIGFFIFLTPVLLWLFLLIVIPHIDLFIMSFKGENIFGKTVWGLQNYKSFFTQPIYWMTFLRTAIYSILVTVLTAIISLPIAFYITKVVHPKYSGFLAILLLMPFWVSELVRVYGWMMILRENGIISHFLMLIGITHKPVELLYNDISMVMVLVYTSMLFMIVPLMSVMEDLDDHLIEAAYDLGASTKDVIFKIIIPHAKPGLTSGAIVVFMLTLGDYLTPDLIGGKYALWFTEQIYNEFIASLNWGQGAAFGFLLLALSSFIIWIGLKLTKQNLSKVVQ